MNNKAITSLTLGIMSIFIPIVGLIIGIFGLTYANQSFKEMNEVESEGKNFAIGGKVCSIIGICIQAGVIILIVTGFFLFSSFKSFVL
ncbi:DUF4190 domain-containing protein [Halobacillus litoralis]|uniref:DUF4190 domain-containing protein n=1 Tax=Halobacillus litoralis TaxID=45668 RepID=A0A410MBF9_9BACI|nr:DUF4190 domain-containing protein [Halobacillus litoralis]QAS51996.1 hypothetical protein HLI_07060 [Halobacillus litoralis]